jgi:hypothetical protein
MTYIPKNKVIEKLYTIGKDFVEKGSNKIYVGFYHMTSDGRYFTGKTASYIYKKELTLIEKNSKIFNKIDINIHDNIKNYKELDNNNNNKNNIHRFIPFPNIEWPTERNYELGEFRRYFCVKNNENLFMEINNSTYKYLDIQNPEWLWYLYTPFYMDWIIKGDPNEVYEINKHNSIRLELDHRLNGFVDFLKKDFTRFLK